MGWDEVCTFYTLSNCPHRDCARATRHIGDFAHHFSFTLRPILCRNGTFFSVYVEFLQVPGFSNAVQKHVEPTLHNCRHKIKLIIKGMTVGLVSCSCSEQVTCSGLRTVGFDQATLTSTNCKECHSAAAQAPCCWKKKKKKTIKVKNANCKTMLWWSELYGRNSLEQLLSK